MIASLALAARVVLSAVLATAGGAKLADQAGTREAVAAFGAPGLLVRPLALLLPPAEIAVAVLLLPSATAVAGAAAALALLLLFTAAIGLSLAHGRAPDCHQPGGLPHTGGLDRLAMAQQAGKHAERRQHVRAAHDVGHRFGEHGVHRPNSGQKKRWPELA